MRNLGEILRVGLPDAKRRRDVVDLCKRTLIDLESQVYGHKLFIRYMQPLHIQCCRGTVDGLTLAGNGVHTPKMAVGIAFIRPADVSPNGLLGIYAGGAVCHEGDSWHRPIGKALAALRARRIDGDTVAHMAMRGAPWEGSPVVQSKQLRTQPLFYPWSLLRSSYNQAFPPLALPAVVDAIRYAVRYNLSGTEPFMLSASVNQTQRPEPKLGDSYANQDGIVEDLIHHACTLPINTPLSEEDRAKKEAEGRAKTAKGCDSCSCADTPKVPA